MTTLKSLSTVRRKPALTHQSPAQSTAAPHLEKSMSASQSFTTSTSPPTRLSPTPELPPRSTFARTSSRRHTSTPLLPLYHPFGTLALSLPDLDPTVFGLPAPVAVFDDPTRRSSHRQRRPAAKVRDADNPTTSHPPSFIPETSTPEFEVKEKPSARRRRGGGPGGKRKRKEPEDGDATYSAKRPRHAKSSGMGSGLSGTRAISREYGSPALSNGTSPAVDARGDLVEERKPERRATRSRGAITRRGSTASEETVTSVSRSVYGPTTVSPRVGSNGEPTEGEGSATNDTLDAAVPGVEKPQKVDPDDKPALEQQEN